MNCKSNKAHLVSYECESSGEDGFGPLFEPAAVHPDTAPPYYLPTYIASSWHQNEAEAHTEIRSILKLAPRKVDSKGKRERGSKADSKLELAFATSGMCSLKVRLPWCGLAMRCRFP
jgi:hypothetical protein